MNKSIAADFASLLPQHIGDRRDFLVTTLGVGFALAVLPSLAESAIRTDADNLVAGEVKIPVKDGEMVAYRAQPKGAGKPPVILVVPEIFGVHEYIRDVCRRLAKVGYCAIAPELFARQGDPRKIASIPEIMERITSKTPDAQVLGDLDACLVWAEAQGADIGRLGMTGFCWGGRIVWLYAAKNPKLRAGVAWYGRLTGEVTEHTPKHPIDLAGQLKAPVLGLYGGQDPGIPADTIAAMGKALQAGNPTSKASTIHVYPDAPHAFHADYRPSYRQAAAEDGWERMLAWFAEHNV